MQSHASLPCTPVRTSAAWLVWLRRLLTHGSLHSVEQVGGPALARCVAAYAHLSYAPPEAVPQMVSALLSYYAHKLRACSGPDLAELAWALAVLQSLYGDVHQAVRRPAYTAKLMGEGARIVGFVPGGMRAGQAEEVGMLEGGLGKAEEGRAEGLAMAEVRTQMLDAREERAAHGRLGLVQEGAEASRLSSGGEGGGSEGVGGAAKVDDGGDGAVVMAADSKGSRRRRRRGRRQLEGSSGEGGEGRALVAADGGTGAAAAGGGLAAADGSGSGTGAAIWLVPVAMTRIWERLALAAGSRADQGGMKGEHLAKWVGRRSGFSQGVSSAWFSCLLLPLGALFYMSRKQLKGSLGLVCVTPGALRTITHGACGSRP